MTSSSDWTEVVGAVGVFALLIALSVVVLTQVGGWMRARMQLSREAEYRKLAEQVVTGQESISQQLVEVNEHLADLRSRMQHIETVLKQVE
jgi:cytochrome b